MIAFKQIGQSKYIADPKTLNPVIIPAGEYWNVSIPKASLGGCFKNIHVIECHAKVLDVEGNPTCKTEMVMTKGSCIRTIDNDDKSYISLTIKDRNNILPFVLSFEEVVDEESGEIDYVEILEFDGGNFDELLDTVNGYGLGSLITAYGLTVYFPKEYVGKTAYLPENDSLYILNTRFCLNYSEYVSMNFCFKETGCYRLAVSEGEDISTIKAISSPISVVSFIPIDYHLLEYYKGGLYNKSRFYLFVEEPTFTIEEQETTLSDGKLNIQNTIVRKESEFYTDVLSTDEIRSLIEILKSKNGVKLNGEYIKLRGGIVKNEQTTQRKSVWSGTINYIDDYTYTAESCEEGCEEGSTLVYTISEQPKQSVIYQI